MSSSNLVIFEMAHLHVSPCDLVILSYLISIIIWNSKPGMIVKSYCVRQINVILFINKLWYIFIKYITILSKPLTFPQKLHIFICLQTVFGQWPFVPIMWKFFVLPYTSVNQVDIKCDAFNFSSILFIT